MYKKIVCNDNDRKEFKSVMVIEKDYVTHCGNFNATHVHLKGFYCWVYIAGWKYLLWRDMTQNQWGQYILNIEHKEETK